jgi:hypothetical protein
MSGPRAPHPLPHEPRSTPLKFEEPLRFEVSVFEPIESPRSRHHFGMLDEPVNHGRGDHLITEDPAS